MKTTERKISELIPAEYNPRSLSSDQAEHLKASLLRFGAVDPAIVNIHPDRKNIIIGGHQRIKVAKSLGWETFPCVELELDKEKERELNIRLNKNTGSWDYDSLANYFDVEELIDWGFKDEELFGDVEAEELEAEEDNYEIQDEIHTDIVLGDLIEIGEHRLLCGDSTDSDQVARLMNGKKADLLLTDPPYGIGIDGQKESKAKNPKHNRKHHEFRGWDNARPEQSTFELILSFADKAIIWGGNYFADLLPATRGWIYWSKGQDGLTMSDGELAWTSEDKPLRAVTVNRAALQGSVHPTQKPIEVMTFCLKWAENCNLIFDAFTGSGSTMVASHKLNRKCYGMELDPKYCQVIIDRMIKLDESLQVKINGNPYVKNTDNT